MTRILVIEDDAMLGTALSTVLQAKHEVLVRSSPPSIDEVNALHPDLLLLDFNAVPGGAASFIGELRTVEPMTRLPIVLMSGDHEALHSDPVLNAQCQGFLAKPFSMKELDKAIDAILPR